jgi:hypothetical protein
LIFLFASSGGAVVDGLWEDVLAEVFPVGAGVDEVEVPGLVDGDGGSDGVRGGGSQVEEAAVLGEDGLSV